MRSSHDAESPHEGFSALASAGCRRLALIVLKPVCPSLGRGRRGLVSKPCVYQAPPFFSPPSTTSGALFPAAPASADSAVQRAKACWKQRSLRATAPQPKRSSKDGNASRLEDVCPPGDGCATPEQRRSEEHTSELQSPYDLVC